MKKAYDILRKFVNLDLMNYYQRFITRKNIKNKLSKLEHNLSDEEKMEVKNFWKQRGVSIKSYWHQWYYSQNGKFDVRYIPEDLFYSRIEPYLNNYELSKAYSDKSMYNFWFTNSRLPSTLLLNINGVYYNSEYRIIDLHTHIDAISHEDKLIIKSSIESGGGKNIKVISETNHSKMKEVLLRELTISKSNFVVQKFIKQHNELSQMNPSSVNTIRLMTLLIDDRIEFLSAHLRIGTDNSFYDHNGIVCGVNENGETDDKAFKYKIGTIINQHPQGYSFSGIKIPGFRKMVEAAKKEHEKFAHFRLISWDYAIDYTGEPILIEFNLRFQGLNHHQLTSGPVFGLYTEKLMDEIFSNK